jgi:glycosyltransferase involved in cell wall biosynthesis
MSRNMLPFERAEMRRYGLSWLSLKLLLLRQSQISTLRKADGVIFLTEYARSAIVRQTKCLQGRWAIIPHGVDRRFCLAPRTQQRLSAYSQSEPFRLLYVSTVHLYKHQWHVAEAVAQLRQEGIPIELELVGMAYLPALRRLRQVIDRVDPLEDFIHYLGPVPYSEIAGCYHRADAFIFASSCENMPNILLEAMAAGLPIACSNRGPMPEVLGGAGVYFGPERPDEIVQALRSLVKDPALREQCARSAYERAQGYSWERCSTDTLGFIVQVANSTCV